MLAKPQALTCCAVVLQQRRHGLLAQQRTKVGSDGSQRR
jgi:hypothetical protein